MALLQIAEPGQYQAPHAHKLAVGIDLGTTHSLVASVRSGMAQVLVDGNGHSVLPSIVHLHSDGSTVLVGHAAATYIGVAPANTISSVKRFMGKSLRDIGFSHPYTLQGADKEMPTFNTCHGNLTPVDISAHILRALTTTATLNLGGDIKGAVITVPAYFDDAQRQATKDAAALAGLNVLRMINEPTAAALAYGLDANYGASLLDNQCIAVYDLGGGTFDVSILRLNKGIFEVLATGGHTALGGDDIDRLVARWFLQQHNLGELKALAANDLQALVQVAKQCKQSLSNQAQVTMAWQGCSSVLPLATFNTLIAPLITRSTQLCHKALLDAKLNAAHINHVLLVGGSTRIPYVQQQVAECFGTAPVCHIDPETVVALGAARLADQLIGNQTYSTVLVDVTPLSIGIETMGGLVEVLIPRNTPIPTSKTQEFTTYQDGQTALKVHVVQGERDLVIHNRSLGEFVLSGIPPMTAGAARIAVNFDMSSDGLLTVSAKEQRTGKQSFMQIKPSYGLADEDARRILSESHRNASLDMLVRTLVEEKVEAQREIAALHAVLAGQLPAGYDSGPLRQAMGQVELFMLDLELVLQPHHLQAEQKQQLTEQLAKFRQAVTHLKTFSDRLAGAIMNQSIASAMTGTNINNWQ